MSFLSGLKDVFDVAGPVIGSGIEAGANLYAANAQADAAARAGDSSLAIYQQQRADLKPYRKVGRNALTNLDKIYVRGTKPYTASPGYEFRLNEGTKALERGASARGRQFSGRQAKELTRFGQNVATADYDQNFNRLAALAGVGQTATNAGNAAAGQFAVNNANALYNAGDARASGYTGFASGINSGINNYFAR